MRLTVKSPEGATRLQSKDIESIEEELRPGKGCAVPGFSDSASHPEPYGTRRGESDGCSQLVPIMTRSF